MIDNQSPVPAARARRPGLALLLAACVAGGSFGAWAPAASATSAQPSQPVKHARKATSDSSASSRAEAKDAAGAEEIPAAAKVKPKLDRSGRRHIGKASYYAKKFSGRKMADGTRMDPHDDNAASKTLPLGTKAKVTNLETGKSAVVTIQDRGPYVDGRIVDLSPSTAQKIGITAKDGVAPVEVAPIAVPLPDGTVKPGAAAHDPPPTESSSRSAD